MSHREIAQSCFIGAGTVSRYLQKTAARGLGWPLSTELDDAVLEGQLFRRAAPAHDRARPDCAYIHRELKRDGVTLQLLWEEYALVHPQGYRRTQFCAIYQQWARRLRPSMRQIHSAGENGPPPGARRRSPGTRPAASGRRGLTADECVGAPPEPCGRSGRHPGRAPAGEHARVCEAPRGAQRPRRACRSGCSDRRREARGERGSGTKRGARAGRHAVCCSGPDGSGGRFDDPSAIKSAYQRAGGRCECVRQSCAAHDAGRCGRLLIAGWHAHYDRALRGRRYRRAGQLRGALHPVSSWRRRGLISLRDFPSAGP